MLKKTLIAATALSAVALGAASLRPPTTRATTISRGTPAIHRGAIQSATTRHSPYAENLGPLHLQLLLQDRLSRRQDLRIARIVRARRLLLSLGRMRAAAFPQGCSPSFIYLPRSSTAPPRSTASAPAV